MSKKEASLLIDSVIENVKAANPNFIDSFYKLQIITMLESAKKQLNTVQDDNINYVDFN